MNRLDRRYAPKSCTSFVRGSRSALSPGGDPQAETRYSPGKVHWCTHEVITGEPDKKHMSTSCAERSNLTMRMCRFTPLTNAFSKKVENHAAAIALHTFYYNFIRIHQTLKVTPSMAAG